MYYLKYFLILRLILSIIRIFIFYGIVQLKTIEIAYLIQKHADVVFRQLITDKKLPIKNFG